MYKEVRIKKPAGFMKLIKSDYLIETLKIKNYYFL